METKKEIKQWTTVAQFSSYEEADNFRNKVITEHELVKVKRGRDMYRVKVWNSPPKKEEIKKVKNKFKKGDNSTRRRKNDNKKVRNRPEQS